MKTEKRLTMALSVLVALMMLAVPFSAIVSNDNGEDSTTTLLGEGDITLTAESPDTGVGYVVTFKLNAEEDGTSLDKTTNLATLKLIDINEVVTWYLNENGDLCALVTDGNNVTVQKLINALYSDGAGNPSLIDKADDIDEVGKNAYDLSYYKDDASGYTYEYRNLDGGVIDNSDVIKSDMSFTAVWNFDADNFVKVPINVVIGDYTAKYYKTYGIDDGKIEVVLNGLVNALNNEEDIKDKISGITISGDEVKHTKIYDDGTLTYGDNVKVNDNDKIPSNSTLTMTYTFDDRKYSTLTVSSIAFEDGKDVVMYVDITKSSLIEYLTIYNALTSGFDVSGVSTSTEKTLTDAEPVAGPKINSTTFAIEPILTYENTIGDYDILTTNGYLLTGWNNGAVTIVKSANMVSASTSVTLDAELYGYYVLFMSKGSFEYVHVPFGTLSAASTTLDVSGVNHWAYVDYGDYAAATPNMYANMSSQLSTTAFPSFSENMVKTFDKMGQEYVIDDLTTDLEKPVVVLVACYELSSNTAYAVFDADGCRNNIEGTFGNEYVDKIIIPGALKSAVSLPAVSPVYGSDAKYLFINYDLKGKDDNTWAGYSSADKYKAEENAVSYYGADVVEYNYTITFYNGDKVNGVLYFKGEVTFAKGQDLSNYSELNDKLVAFMSGGKLYSYSALPQTEATDENAAKTAYDSIFAPTKVGYTFKQWNNSESAKVLGSDKKFAAEFKLKADLNLYAAYDANEYTIVYNGNTAAATNNMIQVGTVDESLSFYGESTFSNDGYKLKEWNTRPDGNGTSYALGASFTLTGEQYGKLDKITVQSSGINDQGFILYAIWEKVDGTATGGSSSDNDGDKNSDSGMSTETIILAAILVLIIIALIVIVIMMRKK